MYIEIEDPISPHPGAPNSPNLCTLGSKADVIDIFGVLGMVGAGHMNVSNGEPSAHYTWNVSNKLLCGMRGSFLQEPAAKNSLDSLKLFCWASSIGLALFSKSLATSAAQADLDILGF